MSAVGVRCSGVSLGYGAFQVLAGIDLEVRPGSWLALLGPSGCGKSTLLRCLAGLETPAGGSIEPQPRLGSAALMPQRDCLLPWRTLLDNVALGPELGGVPAPRERARRGLREFGLAEFADALPSALSGGMRQRAALLRTTLAGKGLLLLDEPLGALDSLTRMTLQQWLEGLWLAAGPERPSVVLVTHDPAEAVILADEVVVLSPRPARVLGRWQVPAGRPRPPEFRTSPQAVALQAALLGALGASGHG